ncbi:MAG: hypothetical protein IPJ58_12155 [Ardenticatenia bacterium]|nr:hypothetical protein [Ardenticatenia bacterium]
MSAYYAGLCDASPLLCSHVFIDGAILVQINGDLPKDKARKYDKVMRQTP